MTNYYEILGVTSKASPTEIRAAYKQLAFKYHPDRNPGFPEAEEIFKRVNEAYHVLSDPIKKINYDAHFILPPRSTTEATRREMNRRRYWYYFMKTQDRPYKLDKEYFKIQGLVFLVFIVISGFCFALVHTAQYINEKKHLKKYQATAMSLKKVNDLFTAGKFDDAFSLIKSLDSEDPYEFRFGYTRDSLIVKLREMADQQFDAKQFAAAVKFYFQLEHHEEPVRPETIHRISLCQFYLGNYKESIQAMKHLHNQDPRNLQLVYEIAIINLDYLGHPEEALKYFNLGKKLFRENLTEVYGEDFETHVNPYDLPDIYLDIFEGRGRCNYLLKNYQDAVTDCNWAVFLRPQYGPGYLLRAKAYAELNDGQHVCRDLKKAHDLEVTTSGELEKRFCNGTTFRRRNTEN